jgi:hypothetical protein
VKSSDGFFSRYRLEAVVLGLAIVLTAIGFAVVQVNRTSNSTASATDLPADRSSSGLELLHAKTAYSLDTVEVGGKLTTVANEPQVTLRSDAGRDISMGGWAIDLQSMKPAGGVSVDVDGHRSYVAAYGLEREDVATALKEESLRPSGFTVLVPGSAMTKGRHELSLIVLNAQRSGYYEINNKVVVDVE